MKLLLIFFLVAGTLNSVAQEVSFPEECLSRSRVLGLALYNLNITRSSATTYLADSVEIEFLGSLEREGKKLYAFKAQGFLRGKKTKRIWELEMVEVPRRGCLLENATLKQRLTNI